VVEATKKALLPICPVSLYSHHSIRKARFWQGTNKNAAMLKGGVFHSGAVKL
jgi:hypothetical protein